MTVNDAPESPKLPRVPADPIVRSRFRGCLLGGAVGDALGAPVEFLKLDAIREQFGPEGIRDYVPAYGKLGAITDDTQMTLFTAEGMLRAFVRMRMRGIGPAFPSVTARAYLRWLLTQGYQWDGEPADKPSGWLIGHQELFDRRAPGNTCIAALRAMKRPGDSASNDSKGCGGVMRVAPVGMVMAQWEGDTSNEMTKRAFDIACSLAGLTHGHPTGQLAAGVLAAIVALVLNGMPLAQAVEQAKAQLCLRPAHLETLLAIERAQLLAEGEPNQPDVIQTLGAGWVAEEALAISLYCALSTGDFEAGVVLAVNHAGDSDSTGSITGNILGAMYGEESIPSRWLNSLELRHVIMAVADDLATFPEWDVGEYETSPECAFYWSRYPGG
jgi:ADP-ribosyl-[dinitrogen reductase] hydrolase